MSFPGTVNFVGEFLIFIGIFARSSLLSLYAGTGIVLSAVYSIWVYNRVVFGTLKTNYIYKYVDLTPSEFIIFTVLGIFTLVLGVYAQPILDCIELVSSIND